MSEIEFEKKYRERHNRWRDKTRDQLSFFNNLLLTISIGFLSFVFANEQYSHKLEICSVNQNLYIIMSVILILISILSGLLVANTRLYDFRITAHIVQIRSWVNEKLPIQTHNYGNLLKFILIFKVIFGKCRKIEYRNCVKLEYMSKTEKRVFLKDFRNLRCDAHNLGGLTWLNLNCQIIFFLLSIICFVVSHFSI
jgi:hypothetical protein